MKNTLFLLLFVTVFICCKEQTISSKIESNNQLSSNLPTPTASQLAWQNAEIGALFSYDLHVFDNKNTSKTKIELSLSEIIICLIH